MSETATATATATGKVVQVLGAVVDVEHNGIVGTGFCITNQMTRILNPDLHPWVIDQ